MTATTEPTLDPRIADWLDQGPEHVPAPARDAVLAAVAVAPQAHPAFRLGGRPVSPRALAVAAALAVAVTGAGAFALRDTIADIAAPPRESSSLLAPYPETRTVAEASGGPEASGSDVSVATLPPGKVYVIVASCTGDGAMTAEIRDPEITPGEAMPGEPVPDNVTQRLEVPCTGEPSETRFARGVGSAPSPLDSSAVDVALVVPAGVTWRAAVGEYRDVPSRPSFPGYATSDGALLLSSLDEPVLVFNRPGPGISVSVPEGATSVTALLQCTGAPAVITAAELIPPTTIACADAGVTHRIDIPAAAVGQFDIHAGSDGLSWMKLGAEAVVGTVVRPVAPPLPAGIESVAFADGDLQNVAFGTLGSNRQTVIRSPDSWVGFAAGDHVAIGTQEDGAALLDLWSISRAEPLGRLATIDGASVFQSWVDGTHEQVIYGIETALGVEWRRVGFDGSGDVLIAEVSILNTRSARVALAADDSAFIFEWCLLVGGCERLVFDTGTGAVRRSSVDAGGTCALLGLAAGRVVEVATVDGSDCEGADPQLQVTSRALDGSDVVVLLDRAAGGVLVMGPDSPLVVLHEEADTRTTVSVIGLDGTGLREVAVFEHEMALAPRPSRVRLPAGDWILLAGPLGDLPGLQPVGRPVPVLLNWATGERIELVNLPGG
jgi:hypothetical protein